MSARLICSRETHSKAAWPKRICALAWALTCLNTGALCQGENPAPLPAALPKLGLEIAAYAGADSVSFDQLDELLLWRYGQSPDGLAALKQLLELRVLDALANEQGIVITSKDQTRRWTELEADIQASGAAESLPEYLAQSGIERETFLEYLRLALVHEALTRKALGLTQDDPLTGEQQNTWLQTTMDKRGVENLPRPWDQGVVVRSDEVEVSTAEFAQHLRDMLPPADMKQACEQLLLKDRLMARLPDLAPSALERLIDQEIEQRRAATEADPRYQGVSYERLLEAQGLSIEAVRRDPALHVAVLSTFWMDRIHTDATLREAYSAERDLFDGAFGEGVQAYVLVLKAAKLPNELVTRSFEEADAELEKLRQQVHSLADFSRLLTEHSEDPVSLQRQGSLGVITRLSTGIPENVRDAVFAALEAAQLEGRTEVSGTVLGPLHYAGGALLVALGQRRPAPSWEDMSKAVHSELRRRFLVELLPPDSIVTWLDQKPN